YVLAPLGYPIAMLLDYVLGPDHGVIYKKAQLKELVLLSDTAHGGNLSNDEVTIIRGALELSEKRIVEVMTQLKNVFMVDIDARLDRTLLTEMLRQGHSRVPVYEGVRENIVGVLLVKSLILLDPDDALPVREARITGIPLVTPDVSLYDILNAFQEGGSHMALCVGRSSRVNSGVPLETTPLLGSSTTMHAGSPPSLDLNTNAHDSEHNMPSSGSNSPPPLIRKLSSYIRSSNNNAKDNIFADISHETVRDFTPLGIITLEDVIEELIQEEIIDETDLFIDMRKKVKVMRAAKIAQSMVAGNNATSPMALPHAVVDGREAKSGKRRGLAFSSRRRNED
ncbi:hypothetical protein IWW50_003309, partial [Coemansia erecta]